MPRLYLLSGPDVGKSFDVVHGATFGRSAECTVHLRDVSVSRVHAHLELSGNRWTIVDAKSRNGLMVGGQRVERASLADGDEFTLGEVLLRFRADGVAATPSSGAPASRVAPGASADLAIQPASAVPPEAPPPFVSPVAPRAPSSEGDSIELEGDWSGATESFPVAPPLAETAVRPAPTPSAEPVAPAPRHTSARQTAGAPQRPPALGAASAPRAPSTVDRSRPVLQYQRVAQRDGVFNAELSQLPVWARLGLYGLAALVAAGLFFAAFKGTLFLKERAPGSDSELSGTDG